MNELLITIILCLAGVLLLILCANYILPLLRFFRQKHFSERQWFLSVLYEIQKKCLKKGLYEYSEMISQVIQALNLPPEEKQPMTEYGRSIKKALEHEDQSD